MLNRFATAPYEGKKSRELLGDKVGESQDQIRRYIRLNELIPQILEMVDNSVIRDKNNLQIAMRPAVELSYIPAKQQKVLLDEMLANDNTPSHDQAIKMRKFAEDNKLDENVIQSIMQETKPNQVEQFKIPRERLSKFFSPDATTQRQKLRNKSRSIKDDEKLAVCKSAITELTGSLKKLRREVWLCEDIQERSGVIKDKIRQEREYKAENQKIFLKQNFCDIIVKWQY